MDRHPQQFKRERQDIVKRKHNIQNLSKLRTLISKVLKTKDVESAEPIYKSTVSFIDKMTHKNLIHKNTAARNKAKNTYPKAYFEGITSERYITTPKHRLVANAILKIPLANKIC